MSAVFFLAGVAVGLAMTIAIQCALWAIDRAQVNERLESNRALRALDERRRSSWITQSDLVVGEEDAADHLDFWRRSVTPAPIGDEQ